MADTANAAYRVETDGFFGELFLPAEDRFPGKALIAFSGSDGGLALTRALAGVFQARGLTTLALAYVGEEGLPQGFSGIPIEYVETAAKRLHAMGYEKVGLWGISKGAELALTAGSLLPGLVNAVVAVAPMNTVCQAFVKGKGIVFLPGSCWSFRGQELPYSPPTGWRSSPWARCCARACGTGRWACTTSTSPWWSSRSPPGKPGWTPWKRPCPSSPSGERRDPLSRQRIVDSLGILVHCGLLLMASLSGTVSVRMLLGLELLLLALSVLRVLLFRSIPKEARRPYRMRSSDGPGLWGRDLLIHPYSQAILVLLFLCPILEALRRLRS